MQRSTITERDRELLSAYLDNQLEPAERARLETRLAGEPALSAELDALRRTVAAVHALPAVRAPRNFTLSAKTAPRRAANWLVRLYPVMQYATVAAAFVFVLLLFGRAAQFLPIAGQTAAPAALPPQADMEVTAAYPGNATGGAQPTPDITQRSSVPAATTLPEGTTAPLPNAPAQPTVTASVLTGQAATAESPEDGTLIVTEMPPAVDATTSSTPDMKTNAGETPPAEETDQYANLGQPGLDLGALANIAAVVTLALAVITLLIRRGIGRR
jgi:hypothetical protein